MSPRGTFFINPLSRQVHIVGLLQHEFIHILIEQPIIEKYKVPQDLKERIVDIIGFEYFGIPVQKKFETSFANPYITKEAFETDGNYNLSGRAINSMRLFLICRQRTHPHNHNADA